MYTPNFSDPRVLSRLRTAYAFSRAHLSSKPREMNQVILDKNLGRGELATWLRTQLLVCIDNWYSMDQMKAKTYILNEQGAKFIKSVLLGENKETEGMVNSLSPNSYLSTQQVSDVQQEDEFCTFDYHLVKEWVEREHLDELTTGMFKYTEKSDRLWNPMQNIRSKYRAPIMEEYGFKFDYDIEAAAPTLILQHAQHLGMDLWLPALMEYIKDRDTQRARLARLACITTKEAKVVINALFCGAKLGANRDFALFHLLGKDAERVKKLQQDEWLTQLRSDIKTCWEYVEPTMTRVEVVKPNGKKRKLPLNSKRKWARYFQLENNVMTVVRKYLEQTENKYFSEHDGFRSVKRVDIEELQKRVLDATGFKVRFE